MNTGNPLLNFLLWIAALLVFAIVAVRAIEAFA
jgi:hypothetical protein